MLRTRRLARLAAACAIAVGAVSVAGIAPASAKRRIDKSTPLKSTATIAELRSTPSATFSWSAGRIVANDDWEVPVTVTAGAKTLTATDVKFHLDGTSRQRGPRGTISGNGYYIITLEDAVTTKVGGPVRGTVECQALQCTINAKITKPGQPNQIIAILIGLAKAKDTRYAEFEQVSFTFQKITWIVSPRDSASGLPTG